MMSGPLPLNCYLTSVLSCPNKRRPKQPGKNNLELDRPYAPYLVPVAAKLQECKNAAELEKSLSISNYTSRFHYLLYKEEIQRNEDLKRYDRKYRVSSDEKYLALDVPGLAERRPSVMPGDRIFVTLVDESAWCEGFVHKIEQSKVLLQFRKRIQTKLARYKEVSVIFCLPRNCLQLMHRAIDLITSYEGILFTEIPYTERLFGQSQNILELENPKIRENPEQLAAVKSILKENDPPVYIIYGPPGTGKTSTMVEAIAQTLKLRLDFHLLVCAPSNSACDLLAKEILHRRINSNDECGLLRMYAVSRRYEDVPSELCGISNFTDEGKPFFECKKDIMEKYRVVFCTLITAGRLASAKFPENHFNRIFIDEAGQAMEPELLVSVSGILAKDGKIILAGDPKQLGPIVRSKIPNGLQVSFLERLMEFSQYRKSENGKYDPRYITKLLNNYRSHESIVKIPNEEFYDNELQVCGDPNVIFSFCEWQGLKTKGFPIIFQDVRGEDKQEDDSPSFFNQEEVNEVVLHLKKILEERRALSRDVGVIAPYRKQVKRIREAIMNADIIRYDQIKVGSVEEFQGQEREVIIISTVRSQPQNLKHGIRFHLGFVADKKRFNVAITRAKSLLIVIGNAELLCMDECWRKFYLYCRKNGAVDGPELDIDSVPER